MDENWIKGHLESDKIERRAIAFLISATYNRGVEGAKGFVRLRRERMMKHV